jgi:hypothetical protein
MESIRIYFASAIGRGRQVESLHKDLMKKRHAKLHLLHSCQYMVAEITLPSIQLGILIAEADLYRIPTLCVRQRSVSVSPGDIPLIAGNNSIVCAEYDRPEDLLPTLRTFFLPDCQQGFSG